MKIEKRVVERAPSGKPPKKQLLRDQLNHLLMQAPVAMCILRGSDFIVEVANRKILELWDRTSEQVLNTPVFLAVPDAQDQGFEEILKQVYATGEPVVLNEVPLTLKRKGKTETFFIKVVYEALRDEDGKISGIMVVADEITDQVMARKKMEESDTRQKLAIEAASLGTFEWEIPESIFHYSERLAEIFGYTDTSNLLHKHFSDRIHPDDAAMRLEAHQKAFENGTLFYEARVVWPDQSLHWVRLNGKVIYGSDGKPSRMYGTTQDITDEKTMAETLEKKAEERALRLLERNGELKSSEERYHKMIEEVQDYAIILLDKDGFIQNWNKGAERIKQYKEKEILGKHFRIFYLPEDQANHLPETLIEIAVKEGRAAHEGWRLRKDKTRFWGSVTITALHDDQGEVVGFSKVTRDLTERKAAEDRMRDYTVELEIQNKELEQFAYIASHDLQEPLRKIQTFTDVIQRNLGDEKLVHTYFAKINSSARRMADLIRSVLNYSRLSREGEEMAPVDLDDLLANVRADYELLIQEKGAIIKGEGLPIVAGIAIQLGQLFSNLIGNALKFSDQQPVILITSRRVTRDQIMNEPGFVADVPYVEIAIADNGIGFEQQYESKIFTIFQRLHGKQQYAGTGIGLALCKKIVENHKEYITASGEPGKGATFYVYLPA